MEKNPANPKLLPKLLWPFPKSIIDHMRQKLGQKEYQQTIIKKLYNMQTVVRSITKEVVILNENQPNWIYV